MAPSIHAASSAKVFQSCGYDRFLDFVQNRSPVVIATLGPENTSSHCVAKTVIEDYFAGLANVAIALFDSFADVEKVLCGNASDLALVPHAYHEINRFYMNPALEVLFIFISSTPTYGLAKRIGEPLDLRGAKIVSHPAPVPLLQYLTGRQDTERLTLELVSSTSTAARMVADGLADAAITNATAAREAGLEMASIYGAIKMSWSLFCRKEVAA